MSRRLPFRLRAELAEVSRRQMGGRPRPRHVTERARAVSREQFERNRALIVGQHGFYARLRYGMVVETGMLPEDFWKTATIGGGRDQKTEGAAGDLRPPTSTGDQTP